MTATTAELRQAAGRGIQAFHQNEWGVGATTERILATLDELYPLPVEPRTIAYGAGQYRVVRGGWEFRFSDHTDWIPTTERWPNIHGPQWLRAFAKFYLQETEND